MRKNSWPQINADERRCIEDALSASSGVLSAARSWFLTTRKEGKQNAYVDETAPGWDRLENRGTEAHTFELAWWSEVEAAVPGGGSLPAPSKPRRGSEKVEKE
jgi:hypothetical protein